MNVCWMTSFVVPHFHNVQNQHEDRLGSAAAIELVTSGRAQAYPVGAEGADLSSFFLGNKSLVVATSRLMAIPWLDSDGHPISTPVAEWGLLHILPSGNDFF